MGPDIFQQAWHAQSAQTRVTVDADLLLKEFERSRHDFRAIIFRRDTIEVGVALLSLPYWIYAGVANSLPWTWFLAVPAFLWVGGFILVDRVRHKRKPGEPGEPLLKSVQASLDQVEHQIWLLRNAFWWYLLPLGVAILAYFVHVTWLTSRTWLEAVAAMSCLSTFVVVTNAFIYYINQRAVRLRLEPRRQELLALGAGLGDESAEEQAAVRRQQSAADSRKLRRGILGAMLCLVLLVVVVLAMDTTNSSYDGPPRSGGPAGDSLASLVTELRKEKKLVGLAAMVMVDGQVEAVAVQGERKQGTDVPLEINDRWHLGGITKSITATMIARLVESGQMQWTDTVGESFPEATMHESWQPVTLRQLLTDTGGAPVNLPFEFWSQRPPLGPERTQARRVAVLQVIADETAYPPGERFLYSNVGYTIAGAMAEKATGVTWEDLVKREVFQPLNLTESGFGPPPSGDKTFEQPRGHRQALAGKVAADDQADNTPLVGPAGTVHMSLRDLCTFGTEHLRGDRGAGELLTAESYQLLHAPALNNYACGWLRSDSSAEIPYTTYWHNGSNTLWYALVAFIPELNLVVAVSSNDGDLESAEAAAWKVVAASVSRLQTEGAAQRRQSPPGETISP